MQFNKENSMKMFAPAIVALFATAALANPPAATTAAPTAAPTAAVAAPAAAAPGSVAAKADKACVKMDKATGKCLDKKDDPAKKTH